MLVTTLKIGLDEYIDYISEKPFYMLMPAKNEAGHHFFVNALLEVVKKPGLKRLIVINDGSTDNTAEQVKELQKKYSLIELLSYKKNLGKEGAIKKGLLRLSSSKDFDSNSWVVLMDADGQHKPKDISRMIYAAESVENKEGHNNIAVFGYRMYNLEQMSPDRRFANAGTAAIMKIWGNFPIRDTLFGQKVFHAQYTPKLAQDLILNGGYRVELSLNYLLAKYGANFYQIPVKAEYKECSGKSGMGPRNLNKFLKNVIYTFATGTKVRNVIRLESLNSAS